MIVMSRERCFWAEACADHGVDVEILLKYHIRFSMTGLSLQYCSDLMMIYSTRRDDSTLLV